jgi:hypothetical protein
MKRRRYPNTSAGRLTEAREALARIEYTMRQGDNRYGEYGRNCRDAIARWQQVIDRETAK